MTRTIERTAALLCLVLTALPAGAQTASMVRDISPEGGAGSRPTQVTAAVGKVFFLAAEPNSGQELWVSDGTATGTRLLLDQCPGGCDSAYSYLGELHNLLLFDAESGNPSDGLWRTDGTPEGTVSLTPGRQVGASVVMIDKLYFISCVQDTCELWQSDGTEAGTFRVLDLQSTQIFTTDGHRLFYTLPGANGPDLWASDGTAAGSSRIASFPNEGALRVLSVPGEPLFFGFENSFGTDLWASDGTPAGTRAVAHLRSLLGTDEKVHTTGGRIYFVAEGTATDRQVWTSDGTPAGTRPVTHFTVANLPIGRIRRAGARAVFIAPDGFQGDRLWSSQGTPESTAPLPNPCQGCSFVNRNDWLQETGGRVLFFGTDGAHGAEPWITDGTAQGTHLIADLCPGVCGSADPLQPILLPLSQGVLFAATDGAHGQELWRTDGTAAGTARLTDLAASVHLLLRDPDPPLPSQPEAALVGNTVYFGAVDGPAPALWASEKPATTRRLAVIAPRGGSSAPDALTAFGDKLLFTAYGELHQGVLWSSQGTAGSTVPIGMADVPYQGRSWEPTVAGGRLFLRQIGIGLPPGPNGSLWRTDGTPAGTLQLKAGGVTAGLTVFQGQLFFSSGTPGHPEIWCSDGTPGGTVKVFDAPGFADPTWLTGLGSDLYFFDNSRSVWHSDGTRDGTQKLADLLYLDVRSRPPMVRAGARTVFLAGFPWATDGTPGGTLPLFSEDSRPGSRASDLVLFQGSAWFFASTAGARGLWRSDGTPAGTVLVKEFSGFNLTDPRASFMTVAGGRLWFAADDGVHGNEPWTSDGTAGGTVMVRDIAPGLDNSFPSGFTAAGERIFFKATDGEHGFELWQSDGTAAGTRMVQDIAPLAGSSHPDHLTVVGDRLFFAADDGPSGRELWALPLSGPAGCQPADTVLCLGGRYRVEARWRDPQGNTGSGHAVSLTADTGTFWFFSPSNVEVILKVLDGRGVNGHVWVFYGALSNVEYTLTVTDTQTGLARQYYNPPGQLASVGDVYGFGPRGANGANPHPSIATAPPSPPALISTRQDKAAAVSCHADAQTLCLSNDRFAVTVAWKDFQGHTGSGTATPLSGDSGTTGTFWFFNASNVELVVKALDGRPVNNHFWLFYGALSNVEYTLTVTDTQTGTIKKYSNPSGRFASVGDTLAF